MTSQIDPTVLVFGSPTTASIRQNFLVAKNEIEAIQALIGTSGGTGGFAPPITIAGSGSISLPTTANYFVLVNNTTGGPINVQIPNGLVAGQQVIIKDAN